MIGGHWRAGRLPLLILPFAVPLAVAFLISACGSAQNREAKPAGKDTSSIASVNAASNSPEKLLLGQKDLPAGFELGPKGPAQSCTSEAQSALAIFISTEGGFSEKITLLKNTNAANSYFSEVTTIGCATETGSTSQPKTHPFEGPAIGSRRLFRCVSVGSPVLCQIYVQSGDAVLAISGVGKVEASVRGSTVKLATVAVRHYTDLERSALTK